MTQQHKQQHNNQTGAVSLFVVIFATLLMLVITVSFVQLMLHDQQQATASDVSQSAYDSAQAGVEDAKRALLLNLSCVQGTAAPAVNCGAVQAAINSGACNSVAAALTGNSNAPTETSVQQTKSPDDVALQQSYTCTKIVLNTDNYINQLKLNESQIIPLSGVGNFDTIRLSWFSATDVSVGAGAATVSYPSVGSDVSLPRTDTWSTDVPSLLRAQLMQVGPSFKLSDFDDNSNPTESSTNTLYLYPSKVGVPLKFTDDVRRSGAAAPQLVKCQPNFNASTYSCSVVISVPNPINGSQQNRSSFLRLSALYNATHYSVELLNGATVVPFNGVQPEVDSTGRANDMFRRVKSRIELNGSFTYPQAAIELGNGLCKNFIITDKDPVAGDTFGYPSVTCKW
jgi:Tfp pilus assembly protein PilX